MPKDSPIKEHLQRAIYETFVHSDEETRPDQQKDNDNNNDKDCLFFRSFQLTVSWKI